MPNGGHLFRKPNDVGGYIYYSNEVGGGVTVWDTCLVDESTLLTAIICEHHRKYFEYMKDKGWKPDPKMAGTGGPFNLDKK